MNHVENDTACTGIDSVQAYESLLQRISDLFAAGKFLESEEMARQALRERPNDPRAMFNVAYIEGKLGRDEEAIKLYERVIEQAPEVAGPYVNVGGLHDVYGRWDVARRYFEEGVRLDPQSDVAQFHLALTRLREGEWPDAWAGYERRPRKKEIFSYFEQIRVPLWQGESLEGRNILLVAEQGAGDVIQFIRYAQVLKDAGAAKVGALVARGMERLVATVDAVDEVSSNHAPPGYDYWASIMSMPFHAGTTLQTIPSRVPYMAAERSVAQQWGARIEALAAGRPRIGLVWSGNPQNTRNDWRSALLSALAPLLAVPGVSWFSLQKGAGQSQLPQVPEGVFVHALGDYLASYDVTAAIVSQLDLVISVDTSVAHLAGALGKPVWVMVAYNSEWRWLKNRTDSPWYPTLRLFRQRELNNWTGLAKDVAQALRTHISELHSKRAVALLDRPDDLMAACHALIEERRAREAAFLAERVTSKEPDNVAAWFYRGICAEAQGHIDAAIKHYERGMAVERRVWTVVNYAGCLEFKQRYDEALSLFKLALATEPKLGQAGLGVAHIHLRHGDFENGWKYYEHRRNIKSSNNVDPRCPPWRGEDLNGKKLLLISEQGSGDVIQAVRYARLAKDRGAHVTVLIPDDIQSLIARADGVDRSVTTIAPFRHDFDYHAFVMSLPGLFGTRVDTIPTWPRYIGSDPDKVGLWRQKIDGIAGERRRIGIVWAGRPDHDRDALRSIRWSSLDRLWKLPGIAWFSLQKGAGENAIASMRLPASLTHLGADIHDFSDTAAAIENLDLVISVDTSVVHLAGALGKPVWILVTVNPDWRWMLERSDSPWYPSARLLRQKTLGDWDEVLDRVIDELSSNA